MSGYPEFPPGFTGRVTIDLKIDAPEGTTVETEDVLSVIESLKEEFASKRADYVKKRAEENAQKLYDVMTKNLFKFSTERKSLIVLGVDITTDLLSKRQQNAINLQNGIGSSNGDNDSNSCEDDGYASPKALLGTIIAGNNAVCPIKLPAVERLPRYTTWVFLDRNQRMTADQSVVGRRRIYYDQNSGEALICSDSEEELLEDKEEKREFVESEDVMLRSTIQQVGLSDRVLELLGKFLSRKPSELKARYEDLVKDKKECSSKNENIQGTLNLFLDKDLNAALDSFDSLFCRRCLVFDCKSHGCSQDLIFAAEKQLPWYSPDVDKEPCCPNCYRLAITKERKAGLTSPQFANHGENHVRPSEIANNAQVPGRKQLSWRSKSCQSRSVSSNAKNISENSDSEIRLLSDILTVHRSASPSNKKSDSKGGSTKTKWKRIAEDALVAAKKRHIEITAVESPVSIDLNIKSNSHKNVKNVGSSSQKSQQSDSGRRSRREGSPVLAIKNSLQGEGFSCQYKEAASEKHVMNYDDAFRKNDFVDEIHENNCRQEIDGDKPWRPLEKALFEKGLEMFGQSSCMIARNLLNGLKTCWEVFQYMNNSENKLLLVSEGVNGMLEGSFKSDGHTIMGNQPRRRSRFLRRRGRARALKYTGKSTGYHALRKRISVRKDQLCPQYSPCNCQAPCGKECPCIANGTLCEKYCGCKNCKNRFRGCVCLNGQCGSKHCACFAANRECDPDVCRNCWISCGDGTLGTPSQRGDNNNCCNMKLLLKQHQQVLLGQSDVSGWGAFLKNNVSKHDYLGEYTGEIISHDEADRRGKIYDRENSSFLFNLTDQSVLDAYRKGDKLKFANHSPNPNCYAKIIMTAGDHRIGIFAKEKIYAGQELFYDYDYAPDTKHVWARKPEAPTTRNDICFC
ncbi:histone-lysine N-methyltransferase CLF [Capsicum annuum]